MRSLEVPESRAVLDALRVKFLYEKMIREHAGGYRTFSVDRDTPVGKRQFGQFDKISKWCRAENISVEEYLSVIFNLGHYSRWKYPYLSYIASEVAFDIYRERRRFIERAFVGGNPIKAQSPVSLERLFANCFYNGFPIIHSASQVSGFDKVSKVENLLPLFVAFNDIFTPEFVFTHSRYKDYAALTFEGEDHELQIMVFSYIRDVQRRVAEVKSRVVSLMKARHLVEGTEQRICQRVYGYVDGWEALWKLLQ